MVISMKYVNLHRNGKTDKIVTRKHLLAKWEKNYHRKEHRHTGFNIFQAEMVARADCVTLYNIIKYNHV
jgi:hypothetical protein